MRVLFFVNSYLLKECIRVVWIKYLIAGHHSNQIFRAGKIDDVMCPSWNHIDCFNLITADFKFHHLTGIDVPLLNQAMTMDHNELFPLGVVPMLAFSDSGFGNIDRDLSTVGGVHQLSEASHLPVFQLCLSSFATAQQNVEIAELYFGLECPIRLTNL